MKTGRFTNGILRLVGAWVVLMASACQQESQGSVEGQTAELRPEHAGGAAGGGGGDSMTGNGAPSGSHYTLNLIGMARGKSADMTGNNGRRIFVALTGRTRIGLQEGDSFEVLDANGTDGEAAFQLPNPDADNDGVTSYSVFARALGTPGGRSTTTTCAIDPSTGEEYCSIYSAVLVRDRGGSKFTNVSRELLYIYADIDGDGTEERYPLFDDALQDYLWGYDNNGLRLAQLRFYPQPTDVN